MRYHPAHSIFLGVSLFLSVSACDWQSINTDPIRRAEATLAEQLPVAEAQTVRNLSGQGGRLAGIIIQHFKGIDAQPESYSAYLIDEQASNTFWQSGLYTGAMKDCFLIMQQADATQDHAYSAIARILMACNLGILTVCWGDVPYQEAFVEEQPVYDAQETIYAAIQHLLAEAIDLLAQADSIPGEDDLIFAGDLSLWKKTAYVLRARYALHLTRRDPQAAERALSFLAKANYADLQTQPDFPYQAALNEANPLALFSIERPDQLALGTGLLELLQDKSDPRLPYLARSQERDWLIYDEDSSLFWTRTDTDYPLISLTEIHFLAAEAHLRQENLSAADHSFREGVRWHFRQMEIPPQHLEQWLLHLPDLREATSHDALREIIEQKYIALFAQGSIEAWVDYRRTGFPQLTVPDNANASFNPSLVIPRRFLYPISERTVNNRHWQAAVDRQGGQLLDQHLWSFFP